MAKRAATRSRAARPADKPAGGAKRPAATARSSAKPKAKPKKSAKPTARPKRKRIEQYAIDALDALEHHQPERAVSLLAEAIGQATRASQRKQLRAAWRGIGQRKMWAQAWVPARVFFEAALSVASGAGTVASGAGTVASGAGTVASGAGTVASGAGTVASGGAVERAEDTDELEAQISNDLGYVLQQLGRFEEAERHARRALEMHQAAERQDGVASAYGHLSGIMFESGRIGDAVALARLAVATSRASGNKTDEVMHLYSLARALYEQGHSADADEAARGALPIVKKLANAAIEGAFVNLIANVALDDNRTDEAKARYDEARKLFRRVGLKNHEAITVANMGNVAWDCGRLDDALALYRKALAHHREVNDERSAAIVMTDRAGVLVELGRFDEANALLEDALAIMVRLGHLRRVSFIRDAFAKLAEARGELDVARAHFAEAEIAFDVAGDRIQIGRMLLAAAGVQAEIGDTAGAELLLARAAALDPTAGDDAPRRGPDDSLPLGTWSTPASADGVVSPEDRTDERTRVRAGTAAVRALRELATGRIEVARARAAPPEEARHLRERAATRLAAVEDAEDSLVDRSSEVRRVAQRLRAALERAPG